MKHVFILKVMKDKLNMNVESHKQWIEEIKKYLTDYSDEDIVKYSLSFTLQSLRNNIDMSMFKWE